MTGPAPVMARARRGLRAFFVGGGIAGWEWGIVTVAVAALSVWRWNETSGYWFWSDDWTFLALDNLSFADWMRSHGGHWTVVPNVAYRVLFGLFGMDFAPGYRLFIVGGHALFGIAVWRILRWRGADPVVALVVPALTVVLLSTVTFKTVSVGLWVAGPAVAVSAVLIGRHSKPSVTLRFGVAALMLLACMSIGLGPIALVSMLVTAVAMGRRRWLVPLGVVLALYLLWTLVYGDSSSSGSRVTVDKILGLPGGLLERARSVLETMSFPDLPLGWVLVVALAGLLVWMAWTRRLGYVEVTLLLTVLAYLVGLQVNRSGFPGNGLRYANIPFFLLVIALVPHIPAVTRWRGQLVVLGIGMALIIVQASAFADQADVHVGQQSGKRVPTNAMRVLITRGEPYVATAGLPPRPQQVAAVAEADGWDSSPSDELGRGLEERARGRLRFHTVAPSRPFRSGLFEDVSAADPPRVDGEALSECVPMDPGGLVLDYDDAVVFALRPAGTRPKAKVMVETRDSFGVGRMMTTVKADSFVYFVDPPEGGATIEIQPRGRPVEICAHPAP